MDTRPPVGLSPRFGPFDGEALAAEKRRAEAGAAFASIRCQAAILLTAVMSIALAGSMFLVQLARLNAVLAACAGV